MVVGTHRAIAFELYFEDIEPRFLRLRKKQSAATKQLNDLILKNELASYDASTVRTSTSTSRTK